MANSQSLIRKVFPGGNTSLGFFSYYDHIIEPDASRIFLLKGGPGVGKSTFMKKIGEVMLEKGYDLEHHYCSSDPNSLDALVILKLKVALIDGTHPHLVDPQNPGAVDELINLGEFWDESELIKNRDRIVEVNKKTGDCFHYAYRHLKVSGEIYRHMLATTKRALDLDSLYKLVAELREKIFGHKNPVKFLPKQRSLFAGAITPEGPINYLNTIFIPEKPMEVVSTAPKRVKSLFILEGPSAGGKDIIVSKLIESTLEKGFTAETFYCPLLPNKPEHLYLPELKAGVISSHYPHHYPKNKNAEVIDTTTLFKPLDTLASEAVREDQSVLEDFLAKAVNWLKKAKRLHDHLEEYYVPYMDFQGIKDLRIKTIKKILRG